MTTFTKQTIFTYQIDIGSLSPSYKDRGQGKLFLLDEEGKTLVFGYTFDDPYTIRRPWLDQAAAEEWVAFITNVASDEQVTIVSIEIVDSILVG